MVELIQAPMSRRDDGDRKVESPEIELDTYLDLMTAYIKFGVTASASAWTTFIRPTTKTTSIFSSDPV